LEGGLSERTALAKVQARGQDRYGGTHRARPNASEGSERPVLLPRTAGRDHLAYGLERNAKHKRAPPVAPGVYRLNRVTVKTYGGREHHYSAEELDEMGFEIVEESDNRPVVLQIEMGFRTDY